MLFGDKDSFGIEVGDVDFAQGQPFIQFRFWVCGAPIGDWEDRIPLHASIEYMVIFCGHATKRIEPRFRSLTPEKIYEEVYDAFFEADYTVEQVESPNLRDRFHMDDIGMSAVIDKYALVLVARSPQHTRLIVKDLIKNSIICDCGLPFGKVEETGLSYVGWGKQLLGRMS